VTARLQTFALAALLLIERARPRVAAAMVWALRAWVVIGWLLFVPLAFYLLTAAPHTPRPWAPLSVEASR
jgi:uncharacterized membrane protein